jgi:UDP-N-acetylenolpyruvoylglucosamine reductase
MPPGIRQNVSLAHYTTLHIGGVADYLCEAQTVQELKAATKLIPAFGPWRRLECACK